VRPSLFALASIAGSLTLSSGALPGVMLPAAARHMATARAGSLGPAALRFGRSIGSPTEGRLEGGTHLDDAPFLRVVPAYAVGDVRWGLEPLVAMIARAARTVHRQFPDAVTSVGHLSRAGGGELDRHRSHESGRDADVCFFVRDAAGRELAPSRFVSFRGDGTAVGWPGALFDDARNWALVSALVTDPEAHVTHLFVATPLRARLLAYAERVGAPAAVRMRAAESMQQPRGVQPHDDHFHVRIGCPPHMSGCVENPAPRDALAKGTLAPTWAARGRRGGWAHESSVPPAAPRRQAHAPGLDPVPGPAPGSVPSIDLESPPGSPVDDVDG
jgi:penicillin-insensitive murein DD-endopeptidase